MIYLISLLLIFGSIAGLAKEYNCKTKVKRSDVVKDIYLEINELCSISQNLQFEFYTSEKIHPLYKGMGPQDYEWYLTGKLHAYYDVLYLIKNELTKEP